MDLVFDVGLDLTGLFPAVRAALNRIKNEALEKSVVKQAQAV